MPEPRPRDWTFRDAGLRSPLLRAFNAAGGALAARRPRLEPERLLEAARRKTGLDDFGDAAFRDGLEVLCESIDRESRAHAFARIAQREMIVGSLVERLRVVEHTRRNPAVREERIRAPFVVLGLPRTGTTLLSQLLDLDPRTRSLLEWESMELMPPPRLATRFEDPRIARAIARDAQLAKLIPPYPAMHSTGPSVPQECVTLMRLAFRSLLFETQLLLPGYGRWLEACDMRPAYAIHEQVLQILQHAIPTARWSLKTPNHLWALDALRERYPDARLIWTHRDPARVVPSVASLTSAFHRTWMRGADPVETGAEWQRKLHLAVSRGIAFDREREAAGETNWCHHLLYEDLMRDPVEAVRGLYERFGEALDPLHEARMRAWMRERPQSAFGRHRYDPADFGFTIEAIDERFREYRERFGIPRERRD